MIKHLPKQWLLLTTLCLLPALAKAEDIWEIYRQALKQDPTLEAARATYSATKEVVPLAVSEFFPSINSRISSTGIDTEYPTKHSYNTHTYSLTLSQPVFHWEHWANLSRAQHIDLQGQATLAHAQQALMLRVAERYFSVLSALDELHFTKAQRRAFVRQLEQTQQRYEVGLIANTDVQEAKARYDSALAQELAAANELADQFERLREITSVPIHQLNPLLTGDQLPLVPPTPNDLELWVKTALKQNLALEIAKQSVAIAKQDIKISQAGHFPHVDVDASMDKTSNAPPFDQHYLTKRAGITLNLPIFEGGYVLARTREASAHYVRAQKEWDLESRTTMSNTRQAFRGILTSISEVKSLAQAVISNESALRATEAAYDVGTRTIVDVLDAQSILLNAEKNYANARYNYILEGLRLKEAAGILHENDILAVNNLLIPAHEPWPEKYRVRVRDGEIESIN